MKEAGSWDLGVVALDYVLYSPAPGLQMMASWCDSEMDFKYLLKYIHVLSYI